jgi:hypothetical protein
MTGEEKPFKKKRGVFLVVHPPSPVRQLRRSVSLFTDLETNKLGTLLPDAPLSTAPQK